ncbi:hypothetical protein Aduo_009535 [Ancylostoma duodenale]
MKAVPGTAESLAGVKEFQRDTPSSNKTGVKRKINDDSEDNSVDTEECGVVKKAFVAESENKENEQVAGFSAPGKFPDYFPFFSLPKELRLRILTELDRWKLKALRRLSHSMYALVGTILPRKWRPVLVDYSCYGKLYREWYLHKGWTDHSTCSSCVSMLRLAYRAEIPRIMFYKAKLTPYMMKRFVIAVKCSQVKVIEFNFSYCDIKCDVEQFIHFLELCKTSRLVIDGGSMKGDFNERLQQDAFIQKVRSLLDIICSLFQP